MDSVSGTGELRAGLAHLVERQEECFQNCWWWWQRASLKGSHGQNVMPVNVNQKEMNQMMSCAWTYATVNPTVVHESWKLNDCVSRSSLNIVKREWVVQELQDSDQAWYYRSTKLLRLDQEPSFAQNKVTLNPSSNNAWTWVMLKFSWASVSPCVKCWK